MLLSYKNWTLLSHADNLPLYLNTVQFHHDILQLTLNRVLSNADILQ